jgi:branched-subunit amino acid transport protein
VKRYALVRGLAAQQNDETLDRSYEGREWMKKRWIALAVVAWPLAHLVLFLIRFQRLPPLVELVYFMPTGLFGALAVHVLMSRSKSAGQTTSIVLGALLLAPFAMLGNLLGGLLGPVGVTVYGLVPLTTGAVLGWLFGKRFDPTR